MTTFVVGASGATGKLLVEQLLEAGQRVKIVVRSTSAIPEKWNGNQQMTIIKRNISEVNVEEMTKYLADCQSVASCLGHNLTWKGIYGKPRNLVSDSVDLLCKAIQKNAANVPIKFVLMNTAGNRNRGLNEPISVGESILIGLIRFFLPPHPDNERAADYLRVTVGQSNPYIEWVAVRPDTLTDEENVTEYTVYKSPATSALFNPGKTSRINVANLMLRLITEEKLWNKWKGQMPVIYNKTSQKE
ncbi:MAG: SDR family oxidoreductase [Bacteroidetes bacterium]|jgi:nucleoside-diphosphate-sugar epimerase|nr:SDR family oxidoreductase [Bacteroidota bacterium]